MNGLYQFWVQQYPIVSLEDRLAENDWEGFKHHTPAHACRKKDGV